MRVTLSIYNNKSEVDKFNFIKKEDAINFIKDYISECLIDKNFMELDFTISVEESRVECISNSLDWRN